MGLKISQMVQALVAQDSDVLAGVQNDSNKKFPLSLLYQYIKGKLTPTLDGKQSKITASGILKGDGQGGVSAAVAGMDYQAPLTIDATPTENSTNPVQSGGVYTDVRTRVPNYGKGENLLRNWYFVGGGTGRGVFPVNQRGATSGQTTNNAYFINSWKTTYGNSIGTWQLNSNGLLLTPASSTYAAFFQKVDDAALNGWTITGSILTTDGMLRSGTITTRISGTRQNFGSLATLFMTAGGELRFNTYSAATIIAAKLEIGSESTLCHNEGTDENPVWVLNELPDYEEELIKCQTSTADSSDTYANKTLATEQQLAYVETGTTASRAYAVGEYFCWNGLLHRVISPISSGASFTVGTNCEAVNEGGINALRLKHMDITATPSAVGNVQINSNTGNVVTYNNFVNALVIDNTGITILTRPHTYANLIYVNLVDLVGNYITTQVKIRVYYV